MTKLNKATDEDIFNRIVAFVERERWKKQLPLSRDTRLVEDLKIEGDDAYEFMEKFVTEFKVDYSEFNYEQYFSKEVFDLLGIIASFFKKEKESKRTLTLGDLEQSVITGKLK